MNAVQGSKVLHGLEGLNHSMQWLHLRLTGSLPETGSAKGVRKQRRPPESRSLPGDAL